jgi:hypothetical protein
LSFGITNPEQLVGKNPVNLDFVITFPEAKRIPLLSIRTHTDFHQRLTFGDQISYPLDHIYLFRQIAALSDQRELRPLPRMGLV